MEWIIARGKEASTWQGLIALAAAFGLAVSPELKEAIVGAGIALVGLVQVIKKG